MMDTVSLIAALIARLSLLAIQAIEASRAGDQAALDTIKAQTVAASNALAPPGGDAPVAVA